MNYCFAREMRFIRDIYMKRRFTINMMIVATYLAISKITGNELGLSFLPVIVLWAEEHNYITKAALEVLSEKEQKFLEPERDLLWKVYCEFRFKRT